MEAERGRAGDGHKRGGDWRKPEPGGRDQSGGECVTSGPTVLVVKIVSVILDKHHEHTFEGGHP